MSRLAVDGGAPIRRTPWPSWPEFSELEIRAVEDVLRTGKVNYWTGALGRQFEHAYCDYLKMDHAIALMNGTVALELALRALGVGDGDEVIVPCRTFIASASAVAAVGAVPILCDVDRVTQGLSAETVEPLITPRTKAVIAVHLAGWPCEMDRLLPLCDAHGIRVVEDCAQAHGAVYRGHPVGTMGAVATFSFCQDKIITTGGEGGMLLTNRREAWDMAVRFKDHGKDLEAIIKAKASGLNTFAYVHGSFGSNYRMTEMQAALGLVQLAKLDDSVRARRRNAAALAEGLSSIHGVAVPACPEWAYCSYYKSYALLEPESLRSGWTRDRVIAAVNAEGVPLGSGSCPDIGWERAFDSVPHGRDLRPNAKWLGERSLMFQVHPTLGTSEIGDAVDALRRVMKVAAR